MAPIRCRSRKNNSPRKLKSCLAIYQIPQDENFYDNWADNTYDLATLDEFTGLKKISELATWLDGSTYTLRVKGAQYLKTHNVPTIICSNRLPHEIYSKALIENPKCIDCLIKEPPSGGNARLLIIQATGRSIKALDLVTCPKTQPQVEAGEQQIVETFDLDMRASDNSQHELEQHIENETEYWNDIMNQTTQENSFTQQQQHRFERFQNDDIDLC